MLPPLPPHIVYAALAFAAGILAGKWLEKNKCRHSAAHPPAADAGRFCPQCGAKIDHSGA